MGTNSRIAVQGITGGCRSIHCNYDGYLEGVGLTLFENYHSKPQVDALMALGDLSQLGEQIGRKHDFEWSTKFSEQNRHRFKGEDGFTDWDTYHAARDACPEAHWCCSYARDRGERGTACVVHTSLADFIEMGGSYEYAYLFSRGTWWLLSEIDAVFPERSTFVPLYDALKADPETVKRLAAKRQRYPVASPLPFVRPIQGPITRAAPAVVVAPPNPKPMPASSVTVIDGEERTIVAGRSRTIVL